MDPITKTIALIFGPIFGFLGVFGWSHQSLNRKISELTMKTNEILGEDKIRSIIDDKIAPVAVEYRAIHSRMDELRTYNRRLDEKMEKILDIIREESKRA